MFYFQLFGEQWSLAAGCQYLCQFATFESSVSLFLPFGHYFNFRWNLWLCCILFEIISSTFASASCSTINYQMCQRMHSHDCPVCDAYDSIKIQSTVIAAFIRCGVSTSSIRNVTWLPSRLRAPRQQICIATVSALYRNIIFIAVSEIMKLYMIY